MSEISEAEIKSMTKEQNYMRGYKDGKSDVLDKIMAEIESIEITYDSSLSDDKRTDAEKCKDWYELYSLLVFNIIDKYRQEG